MLPNPSDTFPDLQRRIAIEVGKLFPVSNKQRTLSVSSLRWSAAKSGTPSDYRNAKLKGHSISVALMGDVSLRDGTDVVDSRNGYVLLNLPSPTPLNSFIVEGKEVQIVNQQRLRPGVYTRYTSGNQIESFVNTAGGNYRVVLDRATGKLFFRIGTSNLSLYSVLRELDVSDANMLQAWGQDLFNINRDDAGDSGKVLAKMHAKFRPYADTKAPGYSMKKAVTEFLASKAVDPDVTKVTLGKEFESVTPALLMEASKAAIQTSKQEREPDNTEDMGFKELLTYDELILEQVIRNAPRIQGELRIRLGRKPDINYVFGSDPINTLLRLFFISSEFGRYTDQNNPLDIIGTQQIITIMGEGGISSTHSVTPALRQMHPSHIGFMDPTHTPEGTKIGLTTRAAIGSAVLDRKPAVRLIDVATGKFVVKKLSDLMNEPIGFRDDYEAKNGKYVPISDTVRARERETLTSVAAQRVHYIYPQPYSLWGSTANSIPFLHTNSPNRVLMGSRHIEQAVPLKYREAPGVDSSLGGKAYSEVMGRVLSLNSEVDGVVSLVSSTKVVVKDAKGKEWDHYLYKDYPLNSGSRLDHTAIVKRGDKVSKGQALAVTNFQTKDGKLALGVHLRTGYIPYKGFNFEDAVVISDAAAKKLTSEHLYTEELDVDGTIRVGKSVLMAEFPDAMTKFRKASNYDAYGVVIEGAEVGPGDILVPAIQKISVATGLDAHKLSKVLRKAYSDVSLTWDHPQTGKVVDVVRTRSMYKITVRTEEPMVVGDKLSSRHANKGIVSLILPDEQMPRDSKGNPLEVLFNPGGIGGRINPGQLLENALGKVYAKKGVPYVIPSFNKDDAVDFVQGELKNNRVVDVEDVYDPVDNRTKKVNVGSLFVIKLKHQVAKKFSARSTGAYTTEQQPAHISGESGQRIGNHELYALLAHGANNFLTDTSIIKSQANDDYWSAVQQGLPTKPLEAPFVVKKFETYLQGAGVNLKRDKSGIKFLPMTDDDILSRSAGEITKPLTVRGTDFHPEKDGLFDPDITGGMDGNSWSHISLAEPIVNPLLERAVAQLLELKGKDVDSILHGNAGIRDGKVVAVGDDDADLLTGGAAIESLLKRIDVKSELAAAKANLATTASKTKKESLRKKIRLLEALDNMGLRPEKAYINRYVSVIPPKFRSLYTLGDGGLAVSDPVYGYREVLLLNEQLKKLQESGVSYSNRRDISGSLYDSVKGLVGITEPLTRSTDFSGFVSALKGPVNKSGFFQSKVLKRPQDLSGRSTIIPDPRLGLDNVAIPYRMALKIYKPFVIRELVRSGLTALDARTKVEAVANGREDPVVERAANVVARERPVLLNRQPTLHKFGILAFKPTIVSGDAIRVNPLIVSGFNADFDGDQIIGHVIVGISRHTPLSGLTFGRRSSVDSLAFAAEHFSPDLALDVDAPPDVAAYVCSLDSFPHGELLRVSQGRCGLVDWYGIPDGVFVLAYDEQGQACRWSHPRVWSVHRGCSVEIATLASGRQIVTDDDPRAVFGIKRRTLECTRFTPRAAVGEALVPCSREFPAFGRSSGRGVSDGDAYAAGIQVGGGSRRGLPSWALVVAAEQREALLSGLIDARIINAGFKRRPWSSTTLVEGELRFVQSVQLLCLSVGIRSEIGCNPAADDGTAWSLQLCGPDLTLWRNGGSARGAINRCSADVVPISWQLAASLIDAATSDASYEGYNRELRQSMQDGVVRRQTALAYLSNPVLVEKVSSHRDFDSWSRIVRNTQIVWESVTKYVETGRVEVGFDLTVPGHDTFVSADGIVLSNTMAVHVPVSEAARKEALDKLLPSQNLFSPADNRVMHMPSNEALLGLWLMTHPEGEPVVLSAEKDAVTLYKNRDLVINRAVRVGSKTITPGQVLLKESLDASLAYTTGTEMTKKKTVELIRKAAGMSPAIAERTLNTLKDLGYKYVTEVGWTVGVSDLKLPDKLKAKLVKPLTSGPVTAEKLVSVASDLSDAVSAATTNNFVRGHLVSGAFGKGDQLRQLIAAPVSVKDHRNELVKTPVLRSFSQGLDVPSYLATVPGSRKGLQDKGLLTAETGAFAKEVVATAAEVDIRMVDCGTDAGITLSVDHPDVVDRVIAKGEAFAGQVVTPLLLSSLRKSGKTSVKVRSPLTCKAGQGICQKCFGLDETGKFPPVGKYIGVEAAQTVTEPTTQMALKAFHHGGSVLSKSLGFDEVRSLFRMPKELPHEKVLSKVAGKVSRIEKAPAGGWYIYVGSTQHHVPVELGIAKGLRIGMVVQAGQPLSEHGDVNMHELLDITQDVSDVQDSIVNSLEGAFAQSGISLKRRMLETVVKPMTDRYVVEDAGDAPNIVVGDFVPYHAVSSLESQYNLKAKPVLLPMHKAPRVSDDVIGALSFQRLTDTIQEAPMFGKSVSFSKAHPVTKYIYALLGRMQKDDND